MTAVELLVESTRKYYRLTGEWPHNALIGGYWLERLEEEMAAGAKLEALPAVVKQPGHKHFMLCSLYCVETLLYTGPGDAEEHKKRKKEMDDEFVRKFLAKWGDTQGGSVQ